MLADGDGPEDFGATAFADKAGHLDDPQFRQFAARYIVEFVERAFEPPTTENIAEALQVLGRPVSLFEVEELIREDLSRYLKRTKGRRWEAIRQEEPNYRRAPEGEQRTSRERPRGTPPPRSSRDSAMTEQGAYAILSISADTPHGEAAKVYKKLQMRYHPDKFHDDEEFRSIAEEKAKDINHAWLLIKDKLPK
jgi:DnaJ-domain-containing protein 1